MKLELNLPALERLLGGDTEIEIGLRHQIVEKFAEKHLKTIANDKAYDLAIQKVKELVNEAAKEAFDVENIAASRFPETTLRLKYMVQQVVDREAQVAVDNALKNIIEHQKRYWGKELEKRVEEYVTKEIEQRVQMGIQKRLSLAAREAAANS